MLAALILGLRASTAFLVTLFAVVNLVGSRSMLWGLLGALFVVIWLVLRDLPPYSDTMLGPVWGLRVWPTGAG